MLDMKIHLKTYTNPPKFRFGESARFLLVSHSLVEQGSELKKQLPKMEFPPPAWAIFPADDFGVAGPRAPNELGFELLAMVRPNGRIVDHWRLAVGGSEILEVELNLRNLIPSASDLPDVNVNYQIFPAAVDIRRNMTASSWVDLLDLLRANDVTVIGDGRLTNADIIETLSKLPDKSFNTASLRWAACISESGRMELQLQSLPASAKYLSGRPTFKR